MDEAGAQRPFAGAVDLDGNRTGGGLDAEGAGSGGEDPVHFGDFAAILAANADAGETAPVAVPEGDFDGGFSGGVDGAARSGRAGIVGEHDRPIKGNVEGGARALVAARFSQPALCLRVGEWHPFRYSPG